MNASQKHQNEPVCQQQQAKLFNSGNTNGSGNMSEVERIMLMAELKAEHKQHSTEFFNVGCRICIHTELVLARDGSTPEKRRTLADERLMVLTREQRQTAVLQVQSCMPADSPYLVRDNL